MSLTICDTPEKIRAYRLLALKGALFLETKGMKRRGVSALIQVKLEYGFKGNAVKVLAQFEEALRKEGILIDKIERKSNPFPRNETTQPFRVILHKNNRKEWVTHCENLIETPTVPLGYESNGVIRTESSPYQSKATKDLYWGHYFGTDYDAAYADYLARCEKYKLTP